MEHIFGKPHSRPNAAQESRPFASVLVCTEDHWNVKEGGGGKTSATVNAKLYNLNCYFVRNLLPLIWLFVLSKVLLQLGKILYINSQTSVCTFRLVQKKNKQNRLAKRLYKQEKIIFMNWLTTLSEIPLKYSECSWKRIFDKRLCTTTLVINPECHIVLILFFE